MKRSKLFLPGIFAGLIVLLTWGIFTSPVDHAQAIAPAESALPDNQVSQIDPGWQWVLEEIDPDKTFTNMTDRSLALDGEGHPHLVYGQNHLYYAWYDGVYWRFKVVDPAGDVGGFAALALDANDLPHISYYDQTNGDLCYAYYDGSRWFTVRVDSGGNVGQYTSIALDAAGRPHISYYDVTNSGLKYASFDGAGWVIEPLDGAGEMGQYTSLALDGSGLPYIAYYGGNHLKYAHYTGSAWQIQTVDPAALVGKYASIALDSANHAHISYYDETNQDLMYIAFDGAAWQKQAIDTEGERGAYTSLALDSADRPYIAYFAPGTIQTAHYDGAAWQFETLAGFGSNQTAISLALDAADRPTLAVAQIPELRVFTLDGAAWQDVLVDYAGNNTGGYNDMALDEYGRPHISYCTNYSPNTYSCDYLKYAAFDGLDWRMALIDRGGYNTSLDLDADGHAHISYMSDGVLKYAHFDGESWQVEAIDHTGSSYDAGMPTSLALDSIGFPHISYCGFVPDVCGYLKYAHFDGAQWITETVDSAGIVGDYNSIAVDALDRPHISYADWTTEQLKHAFFDGGAWLTEGVDGGGYASSLALDSSGRPQIAHSTQFSLKFAAFDGYAWNVETAFSGLVAAAGTSLSIDSLGQPHISYTDLQPPFGYRGQYAKKDGAGWHNETVGYFNSQTSPNYAAMALDAQDRPQISYGGISLIYAYQTPVPISDVSIQGPEIVGTGQNSVYTAILAPATPNEPITITWSNGASGPTAVYSWSQPGIYPISVTARNAVSLVTGTMTVTVRNQSYLPIINGPPLTGDLCGTVVENGTWRGIAGASVCVVVTGQCVLSTESGSWYILDVILGEKLVRASASGYYPHERMLTVSQWSCGTYDFILTPIVQTGSVSGQVVSAVTAQGIDGASVCLASGSPCATTDGAGNYTLSDVPTGAQTLRASAGGYTSLDQEVTVTANQTSSLNFVLSPSLDQGEMRIVLTWGADPRDLDSHLWLPPNLPYHIFYGNGGNCSAYPFACLDVDDRYSYGPETITIKQRFSGTYTYAVQKFTGTGPITASGAHIQLYDSSGLIADYYVPTTGEGDWWYVFDVDGDTGAITIHNTIMTTSPGPY